jgi:FtsP/CotA-like multicopper oxidase with cupredoxin domain
MNRNIYKMVSLLLILLFLSACSNTTMDHSGMKEMEGSNSMEGMDHSKMGQNNDTKSVIAVDSEGKVTINLEAKESHWQFNDELMDNMWTYNGMLPGQEIRVKEGDKVVLKLKNSLTEPTALHLHGLPIPNEMDGIPGVTQNAILPGEEFVYEYEATTPGTYWYHSHQDGSKQVEKGLYGAFIIEPKEKTDYGIDEMVIIDEWSSMGGMNMEMDHSKMNMGNEHQNEDNEQKSHSEGMNEMYDTLLINGKATNGITGYKVQEGDKIKLRFLNAGLLTQVVSIPGHSFKVTHYDGQPVNTIEMVKEQLLRIAPAERYDIEIVMDQPGAWGIKIYAENNKEKLNTIVPIVYNGFENKELTVNTTSSKFFDITTYGNKEELLIDNINLNYTMVLGTNDGGETFTINNKQMPNHEIFEVKKGDVVKVTIKNETDADHPMHLHGHFFNVISRNGQPITGSPILKDTLNVRPNETYEIVFIADNPGNWMFHCHELHHAKGGMVSEVQYNGYSPKFKLDPAIDNKPE